MRIQPGELVVLDDVNYRTRTVGTCLRETTEGVYGTHIIEVTPGNLFKSEGKLWRYSIPTHE